MRQLVLLTALAASLAAPLQAAPSNAVTDAIAAPSRPAEDRARDAERKPGQIVAFAGVKPGWRIAELIPGGGYYTRILSGVVGAKGKVYAVVSPGQAARPGGLDRINAIATSNPNVAVTIADMKLLKLPEPVDLVWTSENYHDLHNGPTADVAAVNRAAFAALKPGGIYYIEDHSAPGTGLTATSTLHRIDPAAVRAEVEAAGFRYDGVSDVLANSADPHTAGVRDPSIAGHTDKFAMRFRKPR